MLIARYVPFPLFPSTVGTVVQRPTFSPYKPDLKKNKRFKTHNHSYSFVNTQDEEKIRPSRLHGFFEREIHHHNQSTVTFQCFLQTKFSNVTVMIPLMTAVKFCDLLHWLLEGVLIQRIFCKVSAHFKLNLNPHANRFKHNCRGINLTAGIL